MGHGGCAVPSGYRLVYVGGELSASWRVTLRPLGGGGRDGLMGNLDPGIAISAVGWLLLVVSRTDVDLALGGAGLGGRGAILGLCVTDVESFSLACGSK